MSKLKKLNKLNKSKTLNVALSVGLVAANLVSVVPAFAAGTDSAAKSVIMSTSRNSLSATSASYDKKNGGTLSVTYTAVNGATLSGIKNGIKTLTLGTDYTKDTLGTTVTFTETYLKSLRLSTSSIKFDFNTGYDPIYRIKVTDTSAKINRASVIFDANHPKDISVSATTNGNTFQNVTDASGNAVTVTQTGSVTHPVFKISKDYLATLPNGIANLTFNFDKGTDPVLKVTVKNSKVAANALSSVTAATVGTNDTITANFSTAITDASGLVLAQTINGTKVNDYSTKTFTLAADGKSATVTVPSVAATTAAQSVVYSVTYKGVTKTSTITVPAVTNLAVSSVSAINAKQIQVVFNSAVDPITAQQSANYVIAGGTGLLADPNGAVLQSDGKTVILNVATAGVAPNLTALTNLQQYTLTVANVLDKNGNKVTTSATSFTVSDTSIPQAMTAVALGNKVIKVTFSKPVQNIAAVNGANLANFMLDNAVIPSANAAVSPSADGTSAIITFTTGLTVGSHTFAVIQDTSNTAPIKDFAGYKVASVSFTPTVTADTAVPQVSSVVANNQTSATVTFSKPMNVNLTGDLPNFFWNASGSVTDASNTPDKITTSDNQTYTLTFTTHPMTVGSLNLFVENEQDYSGNVMLGNVVSTNAYKASITVPASAATTVNTVSASDTSTVKVTFSGPVDSVTSQLASSYSITDSTGKAVALSTSTLPAYNSTLQQVTIKTNAAMTSGTYTLAISGVKDLLGNTIAATTKTFTVTDTSAPTVTDTTLYFDSTKKNVVMDFSKAMAVTGANSVLNTQNYVYTPTGGTAGTLPAGTVITAFNGNKSVLISAPTATFAAGDKIGVGSTSGSTLYTVADSNGNLLGMAAGVTLAQAGVSQDDISTSAVSVSNANTVKLVLAAGQNAISSVVAADFNISLDNATWFTPASAQLDTTDTTNETILFTVPSGTTLNSGSTVYVKTLGTTSSTDIYGQKFKASQNVTSGSNKIAAQFTGGVVTDTTHITITTTGDVSAASLAQIQGSFIITQGTTTITGAGITAKTATKVGSTTQIALTITPALDPSQSIIVKTVSADFMQVKDSNGNFMVANTTGIDVSPFAAESVATVMAANIYQNTDTFTIVFNRIVDPTSMISNWNGTTASPVTVQFNANGTAAIAGANVGTIGGLQVTTPGTATGTVAFNAGLTTLTITLTANPSGVATQNNGPLTFTPSSLIKSASGAAISTTFAPNASLTDAKPQVQSVVFKNGNVASALDAGDQIVVTFSKPVKASTIVAGLTSTTPVSNLAFNTALGDLGTFGTAFVLGGGAGAEGTNTAISIDSTGTVVTLTVGSTFNAGTTPTLPAAAFTPKGAITDTIGAGTAVDATVTPAATGSF